jgi:hypothetical protein
MKSKTLAIFGIGTYILSVLSSATDLEGNSVAPIVLIAISGIATIVFYTLATIRLWKMQKSAPILLICSAVILVILLIAQGVAPLYINITKIINFIAFIWVMFLLWAMAKHEGLVTKFQKDSGLTSEEISLVQDDLRKGDHEAAVQKIAKAQEQHRKNFKETTGIDVKDIVPEIGKEISWADIVNHAFRVLEFDRSDTTIDQNNQVKAKSSFKPYGYLLAESPILNQKVRIPIIHRDDFLLAASVFDEAKLAALIEDEELLVTYAPKHLLPKGLSGSPHHVLHYVITPRGTLDSYYSKNNDMYMAKPAPQKLFGPFVYQGEIKVQINSEPEF